MKPIYILYFLAIFAGFIVKGMVGFGDPLIYNPILSITLPNSIITPGMSIVAPFMNAGMLIKNRKNFKARFVIPIATFVIFGCIAGTMVLKHGAPQFLKLILGVLLVVIGIEMLTRKPDSAKKGFKWYFGYPIAFISGIFAGMYGINNLVVGYLERVLPNKEDFRANMCFVFVTENIFKIILFIITAMYSVEALILTAIAFPAAFLGMFVGSRIDKKIDDELAHKLVIWVFILGGISTIVYSLIQLL